MTILNAYNPRNDESSRPFDLQAFTQSAYRSDFQRLLEMGYASYDFLDQKSLEDVNPALLMVKYMQFSPEATLTLLDIENRIAEVNNRTIHQTIMVRMDSESFDLEGKKKIFAKLMAMDHLKLSFGIVISPCDDIESKISFYKGEFERLMALPVKAFAFVPLAGGDPDVKERPMTLNGMTNIGHPDFGLKTRDMWSDSNGGWFGPLSKKLNQIGRPEKPLLVQNSEGAWFSPISLSPYERLQRIGHPTADSALPGRIPSEYIDAVQKGTRFIAGEPGSIVGYDHQLPPRWLVHQP